MEGERREGGRKKGGREEEGREGGREKEREGTTLKHHRQDLS